MCSRTSSGRVEKEQSMGERGWEGTERREEGPGHGRYSTRRLRAEVGVHDHFRIRHGVIAHPYGILIGLLPSPHRRCPQPPNPKPNVILPFPARPDLPSRERRTLPSLAPFGYPRLRMGISAATLTAPARSLQGPCTRAADSDLLCSCPFPLSTKLLSWLYQRISLFSPRQ